MKERGIPLGFAGFAAGDVPGPEAWRRRNGKESVIQVKSKTSNYRNNVEKKKRESASCVSMAFSFLASLLWR